MTDQTLIERVANAPVEAGKKPPKWARFKGVEKWPSFTFMIPSKELEFMTWISQISRTTRSSVGRGIIMKWVKDTFGDEPLDKYQQIYGAMTEANKRTFRNRVWQAINDGVSK